MISYQTTEVRRGVCIHEVSAIGFTNEQWECYCTFVRVLTAINDSSSHVVIPDNGSPVYNYAFTGLTSNTPYSVSVMASNDGGNGNQTVVHISI